MFYDQRGSILSPDLHRFQKNLELRVEFDRTERPLQLEIDLGFPHHLDLVAREQLSF